jgi:hypothetical protein
VLPWGHNGAWLEGVRWRLEKKKLAPVFKLAEWDKDAAQRWVSYVISMSWRYYAPIFLLTSLSFFQIGISLARLGNILLLDEEHLVKL